VHGEERYENDVEHSYMLAMLALAIVNSKQTALDEHKVVMYALLHDLVEVYAGDVSLYPAPGEKIDRDAKRKREAEALAQLRNEFPEAETLFAWIDEYERQEIPESRFVYALDKLQPILNNLLDGGRSWKELGVTLEMLVEKKKGKVDVDPEVANYYEELLKILEEKQVVLFTPQESLK
jgi:putative hydrolase of HD superfamily